jgi:hypothetical protein
MIFWFYSTNGYRVFVKAGVDQALLAVMLVERNY